METDLISLVLHATGWFDTGRTSVTGSVARCHWNPSLPTGQQISDRLVLFERTSEVFMSPYASDSVSVVVQKALDAYLVALDLP